MGKLLGWVVILLIILGVVFYYFGTPANERHLPEPPSPTPTTPKVVWTQETLQQRLTQLVQANDDMKRVKMEVTLQEMKDKQARIRMAWMGDVASCGGDYLDKLITEGIIKDINLNAPGEKKPWIDQDSRTHWVQDITVVLF